MNEFNFKSYDNSKQSISYCEVDKCKAVIELKQQLDQLKKEKEVLKKWHWEEKTERERLEELNTRLNNQRETYWKEYKKLKQTLTEIKEIVKPVEEIYPFCGHIQQKISEVEDEN